MSAANAAAATTTRTTKRDFNASMELLQGVVLRTPGRSDCVSGWEIEESPEGGNCGQRACAEGVFAGSRPASRSGLRPHANSVRYQPVSGASATPGPDE